MKKYRFLFLILVISIFCLSACNRSTMKQSVEREKLQIVTTIFPVYDWVREILGHTADNMELTMLLDNGVDLHSYQPTYNDLIKISSCDLFIYVGGESEGWVEDALENAMNKDMLVINLMEALGEAAKVEEVVEGMQVSEHDHEEEEAEHEHENEAEHDHEEKVRHGHEDKTEHDHKEEAGHDHEEEVKHDHEEEAKYEQENEAEYNQEGKAVHEQEDEAEQDQEGGIEHIYENETDAYVHEAKHRELDEHIWLSLKNAKYLCQVIADKLCEKAPENKDDFLANVSAYIDKLSELDDQYQEVVDKSASKTLLFGDRFPFRYLVDDYGLDYYAAFAGCSAESEASFETITFLSNKVDELGLTCVLKIESTKHNIAETIISNTEGKDQQVLTMNSLQSITSKDAQNGTTYLSVMGQNLEVLKEALK